MGEKISPDIIFFFSILILSGFYYVGALQRRRAAFVRLWHRHCSGGDTGPPGDPLQTLGPFASASTGPWMRGVLGDPTRGPCRMGTGGRGRGRRCFFSGSVKKNP